MKARAQVHLRPADDPSAQVVKCDIHESCDLQVLVIVTGYTFFHGCFFELNIWPLQPLGKSFPERLSGFSEAICKHQMRRCPKNGFDTEFLDAANIHIRPFFGGTWVLCRHSIKQATSVSYLQLLELPLLRILMWRNASEDFCQIFIDKVGSIHAVIAGDCFCRKCRTADSSGSVAAPVDHVGLGWDLGAVWCGHHHDGPLLRCTLRGICPGTVRIANDRCRLIHSNVLEEEASVGILPDIVQRLVKLGKISWARVLALVWPMKPMLQLQVESVQQAIGLNR